MGPVSSPAAKSLEHVHESTAASIQAAPKAIPPKVLQGTIPSGYIPKPVILPDYIAYVLLKTQSPAKRAAANDCFYY